MALPISGFLVYRASGRVSDQDTPPTSPREELVVVAAKDLSFGEVWETSKFQFTVPITNKLDSDVIVDDISGSCNCSKVEPKSMTIPAGQTRDVKFTIDLARNSGADTATIRDFALKLSAIAFTNPDHRVPHAWTIKGRVRSAYRTDPSMFRFGDHSIAGQPLPTQEVVVEGLFPLDELEVKSCRPGFNVKCERMVQKANTFRVKLIHESNFSLGDIGFDLVLRAKSKEYPNYPDLSIGVTGRIVEDVQATPDRVEFGSITTGQDATEFVTLYSLTNREFRIERWAGHNDNLTISRDPKRNTFLIRQTAVGSGENQGQASFRVRSAAGRLSNLDIPLSYFSVPSRIP